MTGVRTLALGHRQRGTFHDHTAAAVASLAPALVAAATDSACAARRLLTAAAHAAFAWVWY